MLFSDITDCEMMVFRYIQQQDGPVTLQQVIDAMEEKYARDWKRSTVCTFLTHLTEKGYVRAERKSRRFLYSSAISDRKFIDAQTRQFIDFWYDGSADRLYEALERIGFGHPAAEKSTGEKA